MSSANTALLISMFSPLLVPNLGGDVFDLVDLAVAPLSQKSCVGKSADCQRAGRHNPRLDQRLGIVDGDFVQNPIAFASQFLDHVHLIGMKEGAARKPRGIDER